MTAVIDYSLIYFIHCLCYRHEDFHFLLKLGICKVVYKWVDRSVQCDKVIEINIEQVAVPGYLIFGVKKPQCC